MTTKTAAGAGAREDCAALASAAPYQDDLDDVRECLGRLSFAFTGLLGNRPGPDLGQRLCELAGIAHEIGDMCANRATRYLMSEAS